MKTIFLLLTTACSTAASAAPTSPPTAAPEPAKRTAPAAQPTSAAAAAPRKTVTVGLAEIGQIAPVVSLIDGFAVRAQPARPVQPRRHECVTRAPARYGH